MNSSRQSAPCTNAELALIFLRLGTTAFGGPAAHIAMMRSEFVNNKKWITDQEFLDMLGASNCIPGPSSTELGIFIGHKLAGWKGLLLSGVCFIFPAMIIVSIFAYCYVNYGELPQIADALYGIKPVIIAIIAQAVYGLAKSSLKSLPVWIASVTVLVLAMLGSPPLLLLFGSGVAICCQQNYHFPAKQYLSAIKGPLLALLAIFILPLLLTAATPLEPKRLTIVSLFWVFVKLGTAVFGSGYVLVAFLRSELVQHLHWLSTAQLLDAIAVGQFTPGPVFTTATFIGYVVKGPVGAIVATAGIFLPAFVYVAVFGKIVMKVRSSKITSTFIDGVNAAAIALMAFAGVELARASFIDLFTVISGLASMAILIKFRLNSAWLVCAGGALGIAIRVLLHRPL